MGYAGPWKTQRLCYNGTLSGDITGALDETFTAGDLGEYTITEADDGGTEIVLGEPLQFTPENIEEYAELY